MVLVITKFLTGNTDIFIKSHNPFPYPKNGHLKVIKQLTLSRCPILKDIILIVNTHSRKQNDINLYVINRSKGRTRSML